LPWEFASFPVALRPHGGPDCYTLLHQLSLHKVKSNADDDAQGLASGVCVDGRDDGLAVSQMASGPVQVHRQKLAPRSKRMRCRRPVDFILVARIEQRLVGRMRLGNKGAKWIGVTRFVA
jgi:hypothetical protein